MDGTPLKMYTTNYLNKKKG